MVTPALLLTILDTVVAGWGPRGATWHERQPHLSDIYHDDPTPHHAILFPPS